MNRNLQRWVWIGIVVLAPARALFGAAAHYDPLALRPHVETEVLDRRITDAQRQRDIPLRIHLPPDTGPSPVILFSHGLGGSRTGNADLGHHWAARGYVVVFLQHPGSDSDVWEDLPPGARRLAALRRAANNRQFLLRVADVTSVLDTLERWNRTGEHRLAGRLNPDRIAIAGHSFGALTAQALSGQRTAGGQAPFTDPRIGAALIMSPVSPRRGTLQTAFGGVTQPWMLMTGTHDVSPIRDSGAASRRAVFDALPPGNKYELVLHGAEHSAFTDRALPGDRRPRPPNHRRAILALSTAFWDAFLLGNGDAADWLNGCGPRSILDENDLWRRR